MDPFLRISYSYRDNPRSKYISEENRKLVLDHKSEFISKRALNKMPKEMLLETPRKSKKPRVDHYDIGVTMDGWIVTDKSDDLMSENYKFYPPDKKYYF